MLADPTGFLDSLMTYDKENIPPEGTLKTLYLRQLRTCAVMNVVIFVINDDLLTVDYYGLIFFVTVILFFMNKIKFEFFFFAA